MQRKSGSQHQSTLTAFFSTFIEAFIIRYTLLVVCVALVFMMIDISVLQTWPLYLIALYLATQSGFRQVKNKGMVFSAGQVRSAVLLSVVVTLLIQFVFLAAAIVLGDAATKAILMSTPFLVQKLAMLMGVIFVAVCMMQFFSVKWQLYSQKIEVKTGAAASIQLGLYRRTLFSMLISLLLLVSGFFGYHLYQKYVGYQYFNQLAQAADYGQLYCPTKNSALVKENFKYAQAYPFRSCSNISGPVDYNTLINKARTGFAQVLKKAELGNARAQYRVALAYQMGLGVEQDFHLSAKWLAASAGQAYKPAEMKLVTQLIPVNDLTLDLSLREQKRKLEHIMLTRAEANDPEAMLYLAKERFNQRSSAGVVLLDKLLDCQYVAAYPLLSIAYEDGYLRDVKKVKQYLNKAIAADTISIEDKVAAYETLIEIASINHDGQPGDDQAASYQGQLNQLLMACNGSDLTGA